MTARIPPVLAVACVSYGVSRYHQMNQESQSEAQSAAAEEERRQRQRNEQLLDAYGDRESLESLEEAIRVHEAQQKGR